MAAEIPDIDELAAAIRDQLRELISEAPTGLSVPCPPFPPGRARDSPRSRISSNRALICMVPLRLSQAFRAPACPRYTSTSVDHSTSGSNWSIHASKSSRFQASTRRLKLSTFSSDIAYSDSPAASRASLRSLNHCVRLIRPSRSVCTPQSLKPTSAALARPRIGAS